MLFIFLGASSGQDLPECPRSDSFFFLGVPSCHGVCFAAPSLSIRKNSAIIALEDIFNQHKCTLLVYLLLRRLRPENVVKCENF